MEEADLTDARFLIDERHVKPGETVCLFGVYSAARNGIVPDPQWGRRARIVRGSATQVAAPMRSRMIRRVVAGLMLASAAGALVMWAAANLSLR